MEAAASRFDRCRRQRSAWHRIASALVSATALFAASSLQADALTDADAAFDAGRFLEAAEQAAAIGTV